MGACCSFPPPPLLGPDQPVDLQERSRWRRQSGSLPDRSRSQHPVLGPAEQSAALPSRSPFAQSPADDRARSAHHGPFFSGRGELPVLDAAALAVAFGHWRDPVTVLCVYRVEAEPLAALDSMLTLTTTHTTHTAAASAAGGSRPPSCMLVHQGRSMPSAAAHDRQQQQQQQPPQQRLPQLVFRAEQTSVAVGCVMTNAAAVSRLDLADQQDVLQFLERSFNRDPALRTLFHDSIMRLLSGQLTSVKHFVPGDFGAERYFLSMRMSPFAYRCAPPDTLAAARPSTDNLPCGGRGLPGVEDADRLLRALANSTVAASSFTSPAQGALLPAVVLELDAPYESKELAARLQRDYVVTSNIPSIATIFDMRGNVVHQNRASVAFMGCLVGLGGEVEGGGPEGRARRSQQPQHQHQSRRQQLQPHQQQQQQQQRLHQEQQHQQPHGHGQARGQGLNPVPESEARAGSSSIPAGMDVSVFSSAAAVVAAATAPAAGAGSEHFVLVTTDDDHYACRDLPGGSALRRLFGPELAKLEEAMRAVAGGREWRGLVPMPAVLSPQPPPRSLLNTMALQTTMLSADLMQGFQSLDPNGEGARGGSREDVGGARGAGTGSGCSVLARAAVTASRAAAAAAAGGGGSRVLAHGPASVARPGADPAQQIQKQQRQQRQWQQRRQHRLLSALRANISAGSRGGGASSRRRAHGASGATAASPSTRAAAVAAEHQLSGLLATSFLRDPCCSAESAEPRAAHSFSRSYAPTVADSAPPQLLTPSPTSAANRQSPIVTTALDVGGGGGGLPVLAAVIGVAASTTVGRAVTTGVDVGGVPAADAAARPLSAGGPKLQRNRSRLGRTLLQQALEPSCEQQQRQQHAADASPAVAAAALASGGAGAGAAGRALADASDGHNPAGRAGVSDAPSATSAPPAPPPPPLAPPTMLLPPLQLLEAQGALWWDAGAHGKSASGLSEWWSAGSYGTAPSMAGMSRQGSAADAPERGTHGSGVGLAGRPPPPSMAGLAAAAAAPMGAAAAVAGRPDTEEPTLPLPPTAEISGGPADAPFQHTRVARSELRPLPALKLTEGAFEGPGAAAATATAAAATVHAPASRALSVLLTSQGARSISAEGTAAIDLDGAGDTGGAGAVGGAVVSGGRPSGGLCSPEQESAASSFAARGRLRTGGSLSDAGYLVPLPVPGLLSSGNKWGALDDNWLGSAELTLGLMKVPEQQAAATHSGVPARPLSWAARPGSGRISTGGDHGLQATGARSGANVAAVEGALLPPAFGSATLLPAPVSAVQAAPTDVPSRGAAVAVPAPVMRSASGASPPARSIRQRGLAFGRDDPAQRRRLQVLLGAVLGSDGQQQPAAGAVAGGRGGRRTCNSAAIVRGEGRTTQPGEQAPPGPMSQASRTSIRAAAAAVTAAAASITSPQATSSPSGDPFGGALVSPCAPPALLLPAWSAGFGGGSTDGCAEAAVFETFLSTVPLGCWPSGAWPRRSQTHTETLMTQALMQTSALVSQRQPQLQWQQDALEQQQQQQQQQPALQPLQLPLQPLLSGWLAAGSAAPGADDSCAPAAPPAGCRERWHEVTVRPVADPMSSEPVLLVVQTDVTSRVRAEAQLLDALDAEHRLLADIFPAHIVRHMTQRRREEAAQEQRQQQGGEHTGEGLRMLRHIQDPSSLATHHECITVLFADIRGFTEMSKQVPPATVMRFLNSLYTRFDSLNDLFGVYKIETIGDCYLVAGGLVSGRDADGYGRAVRGQGDEDPLHAMRVVSFARAMLKEAAREQLPTTGEPVQLRVGIHSGPATSGVVGQKMPRFCLFGDTINTASRMESTGRPGAIHVSAATKALLPSSEDAEEGWQPTGGVEVKGKGRMETYIWAADGGPRSLFSGGRRRLRERQQQRSQLLAKLRSLEKTEAPDSAPAAAGASSASTSRAFTTAASNTVSTTQMPRSSDRATASGMSGV